MAGGHAEKDIAGDDTSILEEHLNAGKVSRLKHSFAGLGERPEIVSIFMEHTRKALEKVENRGQPLNRAENKEINSYNAF